MRSHCPSGSQLGDLQPACHAVRREHTLPKQPAAHVSQGSVIALLPPHSIRYPCVWESCPECLSARGSPWRWRGCAVPRPAVLAARGIPLGVRGAGRCHVPPHRRLLSGVQRGSSADVQWLQLACVVESPSPCASSVQSTPGAPPCLTASGLAAATSILRTPPACAGVTSILPREMGDNASLYDRGQRALSGSLG